jgi:hypothetical protein
MFFFAIFAFFRLRKACGATGFAAICHLGFVPAAAGSCASLLAIGYWSFA